MDRTNVGLVFKTRDAALVRAPETVVCSDDDDCFSEEQNERLAGIFSELRYQLRAEFAGAIDGLKREIAVLQNELALERGFQELKSGDRNRAGSHASSSGDRGQAQRCAL
jgi:hypothetical protein